MASIKKVASKVQLEIERFDGGLNVKDAPSRIGTTESPDCLNVTFDDQGSVRTRYGSRVFNTSVVETGSSVIDGMASYNGTMIVWAGGDMFRASGTTFVTVPSAQGQFASGSKVAWEIHQNILFCSDGTNGPWRYESGSDFFKMGIATPSAPTAASNAGGDVEAGTYAYKVAFGNSHVVFGEAGSASADITVGATASISVQNIPVGASSQGVSTRKIYRASDTSDGPYRLIGTIADNTTTSFTDNVAATTWAVGAVPPDDATSPTPFTTIKLHQERLFFDDSSNRTILRWTDYQTPFISQAENFKPMGKGDYSNITAIGVQENLVSVFKQGSIWVAVLNDPSDDTTWQFVKSPANIGIVGPRAFWEGPGYIFFLGRSAVHAGLGNITGFHILTGLNVQDAAYGPIRTQSISEKIEENVLAFPSAGWGDVSIEGFNNALYSAVTLAGSTANNNIYWFDINRIGGDGQPGSWSLWDGMNPAVLLVHEGNLYYGSSTANGQVYQMEVADLYEDTGAAINSYFWSKEYGGEQAIESWIKDFRWINLWYELLGDWNMNLRYRLDGESGLGTSIQLDLSSTGSLWDVAEWDVDVWGGGSSRRETQNGLGTSLGRRIQFRFDNQNAVGQAFQVHALKLLMNLRRQR